MENKPSNPHQTKFNDANEKALGFSGGKGNEISHARDWNNDYEWDLIGREYCRDRQIPVSKDEFQTFVIWQQAKGQLIMAHYKWIKSVLDQMNKLIMHIFTLKHTTNKMISMFQNILTFV